jgi:hypothetical protein
MTKVWRDVELLPDEDSQRLLGSDLQGVAE